MAHIVVCTTSRSNSMCEVNYTQRIEVPFSPMQHTKPPRLIDNIKPPFPPLPPFQWAFSDRFEMNADAPTMVSLLFKSISISRCPAPPALGEVGIYTSCLSISSYAVALAVFQSGILCAQTLDVPLFPFLLLSPSSSTRPYIHHKPRPTKPATRKPETVSIIQCFPIQKISWASFPCQLLPPCHRKKAHGCLLYSSPMSTLTLPASLPSQPPPSPPPRTEEPAIAEDARPRLYFCQTTLRKRGPVLYMTVM